MKKLSLASKLVCVLAILLATFGVIGFSNYLADALDTSDSKSIKDDVIDDSETVTLSFKYAVCESVEKTEYDKIEIKSGTTTTKDDYDAFFEYMTRIVQGGLEKQTISVGSHGYLGTGDYSGYQLILDVSAEIKYTNGFCGDTYTGAYTLSKKQPATYVKNFNYYDQVVKEKTQILKNKSLTASELSELLSLSEENNYKFVGLAEEGTDGAPSETAVSLPLTVTESKTYYAVFNKVDMTDATKYNLGKTISNYSESKSYTFNAGLSAENEFDLKNDISYFEKENMVFLGDKSSTITASNGDTVNGSKISSGVTVNFGLNSGDVFIQGTSGAVYDLEPEDSAHANQYTICLQSDLYVYGTLVIGANFGTTQNVYYEGHIANEYVTLDLKWP